MKCLSKGSCAAMLVICEDGRGRWLVENILKVLGIVDGDGPCNALCSTLDGTEYACSHLKLVVHCLTWFL